MKKINVERSIVYRFDSRDDLANCIDRIGENGYFSDYKDFSQYKEGVLKVITVSDGIGYPYGCKNDNGYKYFIPRSLAIFEEDPKKYRPFKTIDEFLSNTSLKLPINKFQFITFRNKKGDIYNLVYNGYDIDEFGIVHIYLGPLAISLEELFNDYEYESDSFEWMPFGIEE